MLEPEPKDIRLRKLRMRSWRRGTKEMDLILGPFSDTALEALSLEELGRYEALLGEDDNSLYRWVTGTEETPEAYSGTLDAIRQFHQI